MRLDKYLSDCGAASRRESKRLIRAGRVTVDGRPAAGPEQALEPETARVCLDGAPLRYSRFHYYMMDKPAGVLTATRDGAQKTVLDLLPPELRRGLVPAGRLDKDTTGLLLLTDDGDYVHRVISPRSHVPKVYLARTDGMPTRADVERFARGVTLGDGTRCLPARLELLPEQGGCCVTVREGKYHMVKRMLAGCGTPVLALRRLAIGALELDASLGPGGFRALSAAEAERVFLEKMA